MGIFRVTIWVLGLLTYLLCPPDPSSGYVLQPYGLDTLDAKGLGFRGLGFRDPT